MKNPIAIQHQMPPQIAMFNNFPTLAPKRMKVSVTNKKIFLVSTGQVFINMLLFTGVFIACINGSAKPSKLLWL